MSLLREKIIRILLENAHVACFEFYHGRTDIASRVNADSEESADEIVNSSGSGGNGTKRPISDELYRYRRNMIDEYKKRGA